MGKPTGFKEFVREQAPYREIEVRVADYDELYTDVNDDKLKTQASAAWIVVLLSASLVTGVRSLMSARSGMTWFIETDGRMRWIDCTILIISRNLRVEYVPHPARAPVCWVLLISRLLSKILSTRLLNVDSRKAGCRHIPPS